MAYGGVAAAAASLPSIPILTAMQKASKISQQDSIDLGRAAKKTLKETGLASYVLAAAGTALATKVAVDVKDKIQAKHELKVAQKMQNK